MVNKDIYKFEKTDNLNFIIDNVVWSNSNGNIIGYENNSYFILKEDNYVGAFIIQENNYIIYLTLYFNKVFRYTRLLNHLCNFIFDNFKDCGIIRVRVIKNDIVGYIILKLSNFKLELTRRRHYKLNGKYYDICYYSRYKYD